MQPISVGVHEAKTQLSDLLRKVEAGQTIIITRHGRAVAELRPSSVGKERTLGQLKGKWNLPSVEELERLFYDQDVDLEKSFYGEGYEEVQRQVRETRKERGGKK